MSSKPVKKKKRKTSRRFRRLVFKVLFLLTAAGILFMVNKYVPVLMDYHGEKEIYVDVFEEFNDPGAHNIITKQAITPEGTVDTSTVGEYVITYTAYTQSFSRTVHVVDRVQPVITLLEEDVYAPMNQEFTDPGYTAADNYDGDITALVKVTTDMDFSKEGDYILYYDVTDSSGNKAETLQRTVHVVDDDFKYSKTVKNNANINSEMLQLIVSFLDDYYRSMRYLRSVDMSQYFASSARGYAYLWQTALNDLVTLRKESHTDLRMTDCYYNLRISSISDTATGYKVTTYMDDNFKYAFLNGLTSKQGNIYTSFYFMKENGQYKLYYVFHEESFYIYFDDLYTATSDYVSVIDKLSQEYLAVSRKQAAALENARAKVNSGEAKFSGTANKQYNRTAAVAYAQQYALTRNSSYGHYESNCINYVSQCLHAGGIPMDYSGSGQWKYYSTTHNEEAGASGFSYTWTSIPYFYNYYHSKEAVMVIKDNINLYLAEPGDILFIDQKDRSLYYSRHVMLVVDVIKDADGNVIDLLFNGNTNDQQNIPLTTCAYLYKDLGKVVGYN